VPLWLDSDAVRTWLPWLGTWRAGDGAHVMPLRLTGGRSIRVAPLICYDAVFPSLAISAVRDGAELILTLSNDSWFASGNGPRLHLVVSAFRSLETRRPQVRVTNTGISAVITATGELRDVIPVDTRAVRRIVVVPEPTASSLMLAWGDWFGWFALLSGAAAVIWRILLDRPHPHRRVYT
jgi:apolipoprotein N-acyltransferase